MIDDDFDSQEIFDGGVELQRHERGASFGLSPMTYFRLARCCNNAGGMGIEPAGICRINMAIRRIGFGSQAQHAWVIFSEEPYLP